MTEYSFGTKGKTETLRTKGEAHTNLKGWQTIERKYPDQVVTDRFYVAERYDSAEDAEGNCYDWYTITNHTRYCDKTPTVQTGVDQTAANLDYVAMMVGIDIPSEEGGNNGTL